MPADQFAFVFLDLPFNDFLDQVNGYIHVIADLFGTDDAALDRYGHFDLMPVLVHAERDMGCRIRGKEFIQLAQLIPYRLVQIGRDFHVLSNNHIFHCSLFPPLPGSSLLVATFSQKASYGAVIIISYSLVILHSSAVSLYENIMKDTGKTEDKKKDCTAICTVLIRISSVFQFFCQGKILLIAEMER